MELKPLLAVRCLLVEPYLAVTEKLYRVYIDAISTPVYRADVIAFKQIVEAEEELLDKPEAIKLLIKAENR